MFKIVEHSLFIQYWEYLVFAVTVGYFFMRLRDNRAKSNVYRSLNYEETIENEERDGKIEVDDLTPSLENVYHLPFKGASKVLTGGVQEFYSMANDRRSIRKFSRKSVDIEIVKRCIHAAGTAPSGAHTEPWTFCLVKR